MFYPVLYPQYSCLTEPYSLYWWFHPVAWIEYHFICWGLPNFICTHDLSLSHSLRLLCSLQISTWLSNSHFKLKLSKTKLSIPCPTSGNDYHHPLKESRNYLLFLSHFQAHKRWVPFLNIAKKEKSERQFPHHSQSPLGKCHPKVRGGDLTLT